MTGTFGSYKRVFMLGIDGMGAFNKDADTPNMDKLFSNHATTYTSLCAKPTISATCWTTMLTGAVPEVFNWDMSALDGIPTVFALIKAAYPDCETAAFTDWSPIVNEILVPNGGVDTYDTAPDDELCPKILDYLSDHDPKMMFIQFDSADTVGHATGYGSPAHLATISHLDSLLGQLIEKYKEKGIFDDTLFIVTADHGGTIYGGHGDWSDGERFVFLGVSGKNVMNGDIGEVSLRDYPAIVLHALGVKAPGFSADGFSAQMPVGIFEDAGVLERTPLYPKFRSLEPQQRVQPEIGSDEYIGNFIDAERIKFWQTFESGIEDVTGNCKVTTERGIVKRYHGGFIGSYGEYGGGVAKAEGIEHSDVFSIAFWYCTTADGRWMDLMSNKDGIHDSFSIAPYGECVGIYIKKPDGYQTDKTRVSMQSYEDSAFNRWTHFMFEIDTLKNEIGCYVNFEKVEELKAGRNLAPHFDMSTLYFSLDQHEGQLFYKIFDDIMVIDGPASPVELKEYYGI